MSFFIFSRAQIDSVSIDDFGTVVGDIELVQGRYVNCFPAGYSLIPQGMYILPERVAAVVLCESMIERV